MLLADSNVTQGLGTTGLDGDQGDFQCRVGESMKTNSIVVRNGAMLPLEPIQFRHCFLCRHRCVLILLLVACCCCFLAFAPAAFCIGVCGADIVSPRHFSPARGFR